MSILLNTQRTFGESLAQPAVPAGLAAPPSGPRAIRILAGHAWRRLQNRFSVGAVFGRRKPAADPPSARRATPGKKAGALWLSLLLMLTFMGGSAMLAVLFVARLSPDAPAASETHKDDASDHASDSAGPKAAEGAEPGPAEDALPTAPDGGLLASAGGLVLLLLGLACLLNQLGMSAQDAGLVDGEMEQLFTFPVPARTLFLARLVQHAATGPFTIQFLLQAAPFMAVFFGFAGYGWWSIPLAAAATAYGALLIASACLVVEIWFQKKLSVGGRKNLQAAFVTAGSVLSLAAVATLVSKSVDPFTLGVVRLLPAATWANPFSLPALLCQPGWTAAGAAAAMALIGVALPLGGVRLAERLVRDGLVTAGGDYQAGRRRRDVRAAGASKLVRGVIGKELLLLVRDRAYLSRTLFVPALMGAFYLVMYWQSGTQLMRDPRHAAAMAFGLGFYMLIFSAFQGLMAEGNALWLLYTFPRKLQSVLLEKALLWSGFAALYALAVFGVAALAGMPVGAEALGAGATVLVGLVLYAVIAAALGGLAVNPLEAAARRPRLDVLCFFAFLASLYAGVIYTPSAWDKVVGIVLVAWTAFALWQKLEDRVPYLLDPTDAPPRRVSLADGLIAAQAYLTVQQLLLGILSAAGAPLAPGTQVLVATGVAGLVVTAAAFFFLRKVPNFLALTGLVVPRDEPRPRFWQAAATGVLAGLAAGLCAVAYMAVVGRIDALHSWKENLTNFPSLWADAGLFVWGVLAAPLIEEFLFRGLIFQGMRRSLSPTVAVLGSAAVFAAVHPVWKLLPVFVLGVATALSFRRSRRLWASVLTHVTYNAIAIAAAYLM